MVKLCSHRLEYYRTEQAVRRPRQWTIELIRVNIFPYVTCFSVALNNKDPEFPVARPVKDETDVTVLFDMLLATLCW